MKAFRELTPGELSGYLSKRYSNYVRICPILSEAIRSQEVYGEMVHDIISLSSTAFTNEERWSLFKDIFPALKPHYPRLKILWYTLSTYISKHPTVDLTGVIIQKTKSKAKEKRNESPPKDAKPKEKPISKEITSKESSSQTEVSKSRIFEPAPPPRGESPPQEQISDGDSVEEAAESKASTEAKDTLEEPKRRTVTVNIADDDSEGRNKSPEPSKSPEARSESPKKTDLAEESPEAVKKADESNSEADLKNDEMQKDDSENEEEPEESPAEDNETEQEKEKEDEEMEDATAAAAFDQEETKEEEGTQLGEGESDMFDPVEEMVVEETPAEVESPSVSKLTWKLPEKARRGKSPERQKRKRSTEFETDEARKKRKLNSLDDTYLEELKKMPYEEIPEPVLDDNKASLTTVLRKCSGCNRKRNVDKFESDASPPICRSCVKRQRILEKYPNAKFLKVFFFGGRKNSSAVSLTPVNTSQSLPDEVIFSKMESKHDFLDSLRTAHQIHVWQLVNKRMLASMFESMSRASGEMKIPFARAKNMCFWAIAHDQLQDESFLKELLSFKLMGITKESYIFMIRKPPSQATRGFAGPLPAMEGSSVPPPPPRKKKSKFPPPPAKAKTWRNNATGEHWIGAPTGAKGRGNSGSKSGKQDKKSQDKRKKKGKNNGRERNEDRRNRKRRGAPQSNQRRNYSTRSFRESRRNDRWQVSSRSPRR